MFTYSKPQLPLLGSRLADRAEQGAASRFLRFPGGCYVEGVTLANAFYWKPSVGPLEQRPGHWNGMWQYWSTDGARPASAITLQQSCCTSRLLVGIAQAHCSWLQMCLVEQGCTVLCRSVAVESQKKPRA